MFSPYLTPKRDLNVLNRRLRWPFYVNHVANCSRDVLVLVFLVFLERGSFLQLDGSKALVTPWRGGRIDE